MAERINDGGPAFPTNGPDHGVYGAGMTLRDYFATQAPSDEVQELQFRHLSRLAQEQLAGMKYPDEPKYQPDYAGQVEWQLAKLEFFCRVNTAIRFMLADAMLRAREGGAA